MLFLMGKCRNFIKHTFMDTFSNTYARQDQNSSLYNGQYSGSVTTNEITFLQTAVGGKIVSPKINFHEIFQSIWIRWSHIKERTRVWKIIWNIYIIKYTMDLIMIEINLRFLLGTKIIISRLVTRYLTCHVDI